MNEEIYANEGMLAFGAGVGLFYLAVLVIIFAAQWKIFQKAGKPGWAAIVPIYNLIVLLEITGKPLWWIFLYLVPGVNIVISIWVTNLLAKSFGKTEAFTVGLVFLPFIFSPILGFGSAQYIGPAGSDGTAAPSDRV
ncbi:DUF5684 domain-containing protein [Flavobacterium sp. JP2137]|uniref:DUF5684 domain-containing protein n=1 Tax=Flavobacterium sp. JP2137 TaxID=3414510 RepID=UPI003D2FFAFD